jgi:hypothetical protein
MSHREQRHTILEERASMRKIQLLLRTHCHEIAAYFISVTGLLFPRQAIAGDAPATGALAEVPAIIIFSGQIPPNGSVFWNKSKDPSGDRGRFRIAATGTFIVVKTAALRAFSSTTRKRFISKPNYRL